MSLKWDDIDNRQLKVKQQAKELKDFLIQQNEEARRRKKQEKIDDREAYRKIVLGVGNEHLKAIKPKTPQSSNIATGAGSLNSTAINNNLVPLPNISVLESMAPSLPLIASLSVPDSYPRAFSDDINTSLQISENQILQERRARAVVESELQSGKYLTATLSAKIDSLQENIRTENANIVEITKHFSQRDQEAREALGRLSQKLELESQKVQRLVSELATSKQRESIVGTEQDGQIKALNDKINILTSKLEAYAQKTNEVGNSLNFQSRELSMEVRKQNDSLKSIKMHENALNALSEAVGSTSENLSKKMQIAANELFQKIEQEARARRLLEESIHHDTQEYRRMIERQFVDRVDSLQHATSSQIDTDRQDFEKIANALQNKLLRLESTTFDGQEQLAQLISQRLQLLDTQLQDLDLSNRKLESKMVTAISELSQRSELTIAKSEERNEKKFKDINKNVVSVQKIVHESILLSEKTLLDKIKSLEDVLRVEIKSRMDSDSKLNEYILSAEAINEGFQTKFEDVQIGMEEYKQENAKILNLIKNTALQLSKSQDRWTSTFETEISSVKTQISKNKIILENQFDSFKQEVLNNVEENVKLNEEENLKTFKGMETLVQGNARQIGSISESLDSLKQETRKASSIQLAQTDATFEALKIDLAGKCTLKTFEDKVFEINQELKAANTAAASNFNNLQDKMSAFVEQNDFNETKQLVTTFDDRLCASEKGIEEAVGSINRLAEKATTVDHEISELEKKMASHEKDINEKVANVKFKFDEMEQSNLENESKKNVLLVEIASTEKQLQKDIKKVEQQLTQCAAASSEQEEKINEQNRAIAKSKNELEAYIIDENIKNKDAVTHCQKHINSVGETTKRLTELLNETNTKLAKSVVDLASDSKEYVDESLKRREDDLRNFMDEVASEQEKQAKSIDSNSNAILLLASQVEKENTSIDGIHSELKEIKNEVDDQAVSVKQLKFLSNANNSMEEVDEKVKRISMQIETNSSEIERLRKSFHHQEQAVDTKLNENGNQISIINYDLQGKSKQFVELQQQLKDKFENRQKECHKSNDQIAHEIKNLKNELSKVLVENSKIQNEIDRLDEETHTKVDHRNIENLISPISLKLDQLTTQIDHIDSEIQETKPRSAKIVPGSFYKPPHLKIESNGDIIETKPKTAESKSRPTTVDSIKPNDRPATLASRKENEEEPFPLQHTPSNLEF
ncbi:hypothetical protein HDV01_005704 [Terramyces sp. JEL0728]|nr:hypothetical protein HDV01_005704 [Terramyces sp. JEL0728]